MTDWTSGYQAPDSLLIDRPRRYDRTMSDNPNPTVTLEMLQALVQRSLDGQAEIREELGSMRDDAAVLLAIVMRIDGTVSGLLRESARCTRNTVGSPIESPHWKRPPRPDLMW
jgi:hypothetical protein